MPILLFNTLTREKEAFTPVHAGKVGIYSCGPTVYNFAHIGNLRAYVFADLLKRMFQYQGFQVNHVMNITDVGHLTSDADTGEDKLEKGAQREHKTVWEIAEFYTKAFQHDLAALHILPPTQWVKATDTIQDQIRLISTLQHKGFTYKIDDGLYFDTSKFPDYGKMACLDLEHIKAGARVEMAEGKQNATDFALWKCSPKDSKRQMEWDSPWCKGFPGWHIECSAMSMKYLGIPFDIHTGGIDHIPIHHTNEIAQNQAATGQQVVHYWMHNEFLVMGKAKMAKSAGTFLTLQALKDKGYDPLCYRYFLLTVHYRKQAMFSWDAMETAKKSLERLQEIVRELATQDPGTIPKTYAEQFKETISDDLNIPQALAILWEALRDPAVADQDKYALCLELDRVLGLGMQDWKRESITIPADVESLVEEREQARKNKDWANADRLRKAIQDKGFMIRDTPDGPQLDKNN